MQSIEKESEELLGVVLVRSAELRSDSADVLAKGDGREEGVLLSPDGANELGYGIGESSTSAKGVDGVNVALVGSVWRERADISCKSHRRRKKTLTLEVPSEGYRRRKTLNRRVHVAGVAEILEARQADRIVVEVEIGWELRPRRRVRADLV